MENTNTDGIINMGGSRIIFNGGTPLAGCPADWNEARAIEFQLNDSTDNEGEGPAWSFDCGFKLDYDGGIVRICSRFYPPKSHYGPTWDGTVTVFILEKEVQEKAFDCPTLSELKAEVEAYVKSIIASVETVLTTPPS